MAYGMTNAGSGGGSWATVIVNYPSGSTLTTTNISRRKNITAGQTLCYVSRPVSGVTQSCVFTITDGTQTRTQTVSNITVGTAQTITINYSIILYENGVVNPRLGSPAGVGSISTSGIYLIYDIDDGVGSAGTKYYSTMLDLSGYSYIDFDIYKYRGHGDFSSVVGVTGDGQEYTASVNLPNSPTPDTYIYPTETKTLDISNISSGYLSFSLYAMNWDSDMYITKIRMY